MCPGEIITFTCETRGSGVLVWTSNDYIGRGSQLEFTEFNDLDVIRTSSINSYTVATFVINTNIDGRIVLVSQLNINVSASFPNPSVTCVHVRDGLQDTISFQMLGTHVHTHTYISILITLYRRKIHVTRVQALGHACKNLPPTHSDE